MTVPPELDDIRDQRIIPTGLRHAAGPVAYYTSNLDGRLVLVIEIFRGNLLPYYVKAKGKDNGVITRGRGKNSGERTFAGKWT